MSLHSLETCDLLIPRQPHRLHQLVDPPRRDAADPGLLDHRDQRLLRDLPRLQERREVAPLPQLRDAQLERAQPRVEHAVAIAVAPGRAARRCARSARRRSAPRHRLPSAVAAPPPPRFAGNRRHRPSPAAQTAPISPRSSDPLSARVEVSQLHLSRPVRWPPRLHRRDTLGAAPNLHHLRGR